MAPMMTTSNNQVLRNSFSGHKFHSRSKAQMCLKKIIDIIISSSSSSGYSSSSSSKSKSKSKELIHDIEKSTRVRRGIDIDLNLRLGLPSEESEVEVMMNKGFSACSGVGGGDDEGNKVCGLVIGGGDCNSSSVVVSGGECDDLKEEVANSNEVSRGNQKGKQVVIDDERDFSGITNVPIRSFETEVVVAAGGEQSEIKSAAVEEVVVVEEEKFQRKGVKNEGYLGLLVEAARLISGDFQENEPDEEKPKEKNESIIRNGSKRNESWTMLDLYDGFEDISPVVKSKRGRNQVLPYRYRDSVLDPWKRLSRQRSSSKNQLHSCTTKNKQDLH